MAQYVTYTHMADNMLLSLSLSRLFLSHYLITFILNSLSVSSSLYFYCLTLSMRFTLSAVTYALFVSLSDSISLLPSPSLYLSLTDSISLSLTVSLSLSLSLSLTRWGEDVPVHQGMRGLYGGYTYPSRKVLHCRYCHPPHLLTQVSYLVGLYTSLDTFCMSTPILLSIFIFNTPPSHYIFLLSHTLSIFHSNYHISHLKTRYRVSRLKAGERDDRWGRLSEVSRLWC